MVMITEPSECVTCRVGAENDRLRRVSVQQANSVDEYQRLSLLPHSPGPLDSTISLIIPTKAFARIMESPAYVCPSVCLLAR